MASLVTQLVSINAQAFDIQRKLLLPENSTLFVLVHREGGLEKHPDFPNGVASGWWTDYSDWRGLRFFQIARNTMPKFAAFAYNNEVYIPREGDMTQPDAIKAFYQYFCEQPGETWTDD